MKVAGSLIVSLAIVVSPLMGVGPVASDDIASLVDQVRALKTENAQLKLEISSLKSELENLRAAGVDSRPSAGADEVVLTIDSIKEAGADPETADRIGEIKRSIPPAEKEFRAAEKAHQDMMAKNATDKNAWDNYLPPYRHRKRSDRWEKPYKDEALGQARMRINAAKSKFETLNSDLKALERKRNELCLVVVGTSETQGEASEGGREFHVSCCGELARRVQKKNHGDKIAFRGNVTGAEASITKMDATGLREIK